MSGQIVEFPKRIADETRAAQVIDRNSMAAHYARQARRQDRHRRPVSNRPNDPGSAA